MKNNYYEMYKDLSFSELDKMIKSFWFDRKMEQSLGFERDKEKEMEIYNAISKLHDEKKPDLNKLYP